MNWLKHITSVVIVNQEKRQIQETPSLVHYAKEHFGYGHYRDRMPCGSIHGHEVLRAHSYR
ncbi:uncharacterized protein SPAR_L03990 [Saccharomyces paradoxus]|uniref:Uncharacterized protein n=1 Tax=Saccharomyces paradoxus TaxID=27291 RepID=A0A8B8UWM2_SACPA|nr:uncharacterized protein SPAR_L03990 [Saccharomyces paradoxus]QHS75091.1 hypothetical protein SPAR_L03990 [Saccharomyces paradoxus]